MKKGLGKRIGCLLLCAALFWGSISTDAYAVTVSGNDPKKTESMEDDTIKAEDTEDVAENGQAASQYHFIEEDSDSVAKWLELYCPNGFEELLAYDETWWDSLYDYEREYAEFLVGLMVELSEDVYDGQTLPECIHILESGTDADAFFAGTVFQGMTLADLKALYDAGGDLEDLAGETPGRKSRQISFAAQNEGGTEGGEAEEIIEQLMAKVRVTATGYSGTGHGRIYKIMLGDVPALCISCGLHCRNSFLYHADEGTYEEKSGALGYFAKNANNSGAEYVACQIAAWLFLENENLDEVQVKSRAQAMVNISSKISLNRMQEYVWKFYSGAKNSRDSYYEYTSDNINAQQLITGEKANGELYTTVVKPVEPVDPDNPPEPEEPEIVTLSESVEIAYSIVIDKRDWQTDVGLEGCEIKILEDGQYLDTVTTDKNGHAEYSVEKAAEFSVDYDNVTVTEEEAWEMLEEQIAAFAATPYTYTVSEVTAPAGYVWEANEKSETITGEETAEFELTNERTLGAVELIKYDVESESERAQGDALLDGAVYGIYAAANIEHQDGKTGLLYKKDDLVQTAVTGKTPKTDEDGYILNTDGSRHIAEPEMEIAYADTPGKTLFGDLELGSYYVKEITPPDGYMFDECVYPVTFTYKDQMVKIENRKETAGGADNKLTVDDNSTSNAIYSGDYVNKQGFQFLKTSDSIWQTELKPIAGAGFSIYLISDLSGVKNGQIEPMGENWTEDDIMTFYDYDFKGEKTATVYKRTGYETWTAGDKLWLKAGTQPNEYYVKEMFTDKDGYVTAPELPYGMYVVVETTTPESYTCAKPFIVRITDDGGVLYTDSRKSSIEKTYTKKEGIRYGDREATKQREGRILQDRRIINNTITKTFLRILKVDEEFADLSKSYITPEEFVRGTVLKENTEYRIKCTTLPVSKDGLRALNWKFDENGYLSFYDQNTRELCGTADNPFKTQFLKKNGMIRDCYIMLPQQIPVGTYELEEITAPDGYVVNGKEQSVLDTGKGGINGYEIIDKPHASVVFTINNGSVYPDGQIGPNKYALADEYGNITVTVLQKNQEQKGIVEITKHGEQLSGAHEDSATLLEKLEKESSREITGVSESAHRDLVFEYEDAPAAGAVFEIVAAEDIYTQEVEKGLLDACQIKKEDYLIYKEGDLAATITTDRNGWAYAADLHIGKYKIREVTAGDGFVLNTRETEFEITEKEQTVSFDIHTVDYKNERQKLEIILEKQDQETGIPLAGAVYGLYAKEDIMINIEKDAHTGKWAVKAVPEMLYPADTLVATCITDRDGKGVFDEDLPLGEYYVRELQAPKGYLTAADDVYVDGSYNSINGGQNAEKQTHHLTLKDIKTQAIITKQALADRKEVAGATLEVCEIKTDSEGNLKTDADGKYIAESVDRWISKEGERHCFYRDTWGNLTEIENESKLPDGKALIVKNGHLITGLGLDRIYILSEKIAPEEYTCAEDILFKLVQEKTEDELTGTVGLYVLENGEWQRAEDDILVMYDDKEAVVIEKTTINVTQCGDTYQYRIDGLKNESVKSMDQFTMTDHLPTGIYLTELWTGTYNENLLYDVEYMTNKSNDWVCLGSGLSTEENHHFQISEALQTEEEHITKFRLCFGTVGGLFGKVESPTYMTYASQNAEETILNEVELTAECNGRKLRDKAKTKTKLYRRGISGYGAKGGGKPLYEIVGSREEESREEESLIRRIIKSAEKQKPKGQQGFERLEDEEVPLGLYKGQGVQTGDNAPVLLFVQAAITALTGLAILWFFGRKRKG